MDLHDFSRLFADVVNASSGPADASALETSWDAFKQYVQEHELLHDRPGLVAEVILNGEAAILTALKQSHEHQRKQASKVRQSMFKWLLDLLNILGPNKAAQYVPDIIQAALHHAKAEENVPARIAALDLLSQLLTWHLEGLLSLDHLPDSPLTLAAPLQRLFLGSESRTSTTLRPAILGVLGLLLLLNSKYDKRHAASQRAQQAAAAATSGSRVLAGLEPLNRYWLRDMSRNELGWDGSELSSSKANQGALEGLTASLSLMQPGKADADLSAVLKLILTLTQELVTAQSSGTKPAQSYGKYKAAFAALPALGPRMAAARLLTQRTTAGGAAGDGSSSGDGASGIVAVVLLRGLMAVAAESPNKEIRAAADAAMMTTAELLCQELLQRAPSDGAAILDAAVTACSRQLVGGGPTAVAAAGEGGSRDAGGAGSGWMRGAVEVLTKLCPAVAAYQGAKGLRVVLASLLPLVSSLTSFLVAGVESLQDAPVEREVVLLAALSALAAQQAAMDPGQTGISTAMEAAVQVVRRLIGSYLYQWPSQRLKTHAALAQLLQAAAGQLAPAAPSTHGASMQQQPGAAGMGSGSPSYAKSGGSDDAASKQAASVMLYEVVNWLTQELLNQTLKRLTPQELANGPIIITNTGDAATPDFNPWEVYQGIWVSLLTPATGLLPTEVADAVYDALMQTALATLEPIATYVLTGNTVGGVSGDVVTGSQNQGSEPAARKTAASARIAAATQDLWVSSAAATATKQSRAAATSIAATQQGPAGSSSSVAAAEATTPPRGATGSVGAPLAVSGVAKYAPSSTGDTAASVGTGVQYDEEVVSYYDDLTAFLSSLVKQVGTLPFTRWAYALSLKVLTAATLNPMLQGLYRLAAAALELCGQAGLLLQNRQQQQLVQIVSSAQATSTAASGAAAATGPYTAAADASQQQRQPGFTIIWQEAEQLTSLYQEFLPQVVAVLNMLADDGLCASLTLLLAAPAINLLPAQQAVVPLQHALRAGLQHLEVAAIAVAALESWEQQQLQQLQPLLPVIVPLLHPYLQDLSGQSAGQDSLGQDDEEQADSSSSSSSTGQPVSGANDANGAVVDQGKTYQQEKKKRLAAERRAKEIACKGLVLLQPRIQLWLGRQGGPAAALLAATAAQSTTSGAGGQAWSDTPIIGVGTTFTADLRLDVYLDGLLPQLVQLAETDSLRSRRVAAFEGLHAIALWLIGSQGTSSTAVSWSDGSDQQQAASQFARMSQQLWPALLRLAAFDAVAYQLFAPLMEQIVHFLGSKSDADGGAGTALMEALLDAMCGSSRTSDSNSTDSGVAPQPRTAAAASGASGAGSSVLVKLASYLYGEYFKYAVTKSAVGKSAGAGAAAVNRTGRQLLMRLLDRLSRLAPKERTGAAEGLAACARLLPVRLLVSQPVEVSLLVEAHIMDLIKRLMVALAAAADDPPGADSPAAAARRALAVLLQQWLPACLEQLVLPSDDHQGDVNSTDALANSLLGAFLAWLWPLTASPAATQRWTAQHVHTVLSRELLGAAAAGGAGPMAVDGQGESATWLSAIHCRGDSTKKQAALRDMLQLRYSQPPQALLALEQHAPQGQLQLYAAANAGCRAATLDWLNAVSGAADWCCWALDVGLLDVPELTWQASRVRPASTAIDGVAQFLLLLPDIMPDDTTKATAAAAATTSQPPAAGIEQGDILKLVEAGKVQQAVLVSCELVRYLLGSGLLEDARDRARQQLPGVAAAIHNGMSGSVVRSSGGAGSAGRLCLMGLVAPEMLGFTAAQATARSKLESSIRAVLTAASIEQPDVLKQLQDDLLSLVQTIVLPELKGREVAPGSTLSAINRIMKGLITAGSLLPDSQAWPGGSLLAPGGYELQQELATASLTLALGLMGLTTAGGGSGAAATTAAGLRPPPSVEAAADGALQLAMQLQLPPQHLLQLLLQPSTTGQCIYHAFSRRLHTWLIFNADQLLPQLLAAIAAFAATATATSSVPARQQESLGATAASYAAATAEQFLLGTLNSLQPAEGARSDIRTGAFLQSVLNNLSLLQPLLSPNISLDSHSTLLRLLTAILGLDANKPLDPSHNPSFSFLINAYQHLLSAGQPGRVLSVQLQQLVSQGLGLLGQMLVGLQRHMQKAEVADAAAKIRSILDNIVAGWGVDILIKRQLPAGAAYRAQLVAIADALVQVAKAPAPESTTATDADAQAQNSFVVQLLDVLLPELRKMGESLVPSQGSTFRPTHPFHNQLELRLSVAAAALWRQQQSLLTRGSAIGQARSNDEDALATTPSVKRQRLSTGGATPSGLDVQSPETKLSSASRPVTAAAGAACPVTAAAAQQVLDLCCKIVFDESSAHPVSLRMAVLQFVLCPLLQLAPTHRTRAEWYKQRASQLLAIAQKCAAGHAAVPHSAVEEQHRLTSQWAAYRLLELMYDAIDKEHLDSVVADLPGKHAGVVKQATADARGDAPGTFAESEALVRAVRCAAYAAAAALLRATQNQVKFYAPAFKGGTGQPPSKIWSCLLDIQGLCQLKYGAFEGRGVQAGFAAGSSFRRQKRRQDEAMRLASAGGRRAGGVNSSQLFSVANGVLSLSSQALRPTQDSQLITMGSQLAGSMQGLTTSQVADQLAASIAAAANTQSSNSQATQQATFWQDPLAAAMAGDRPGTVAMQLQQQIAAGDWSCLGAEEAVSLFNSLGPVLAVDDVYDAHPLMLPLVQLIEKAMQLSSDMLGNMPSWMKLIVQLLDAPLDEPGSSIPVKLFMTKAILHVEMRARDARQQQQREQQQGADILTAGAADTTNALDVYVSSTVLSQFAEHFFPGMVAALVPARSNSGCSEGGEGQSWSNGTFHHVLHDLVMVALMWPRLFDRTGDDGPLAHAELVSAPAHVLLSHIAAVGFDPRDASNTRSNLMYITELMKAWGSIVTLTGDVIAQHLTNTSSSIAGSSHGHPAAATATAGGRGGGSWATNRSAASIANRRVLYGLELFGQAVGRGHTATLMTKGPAARHLWSVLLHHLQSQKPSASRCLLLGRTTGLLLLGLVRVEKRQAAAASMTAAGGPFVQGVVELEVSSKLVAAELSDSMRLIFKQGKYEAFFKLLEGAAAAIAQPAAAANSTATDAAAAARGSGSVARPNSPAASVRDESRAATEALIWGDAGSSVMNWLVIALEKVEGQFKALGLGLLMQRSTSFPGAARELAEQLPRMARSTLGYTRSSAVQLAALQLTEQLLPHMGHSATMAEFVLQQVPIFVQHRDVDCRRQYLQLLQQMWRMVDAAIQLGDNGTTAEAARSHHQQQLRQKRKQLEAALFILACDRSALVRSLGAAFWHNTGATAAGIAHTVLLPKQPPQRLAALLRQIAGTKLALAPLWADNVTGLDAVQRDAESRWPAVAAILLLQLPRDVRSAWESKMFEQPLSQCAFYDYPIQTQVGSSFAGGGGGELLMALSQLNNSLTQSALGGGGSSNSISDALLHTAAAASRRFHGGAAIAGAFGPATATLALSQAAGSRNLLGSRGQTAPQSTKPAAFRTTHGDGSSLSSTPTGVSGQELRVLDRSRRAFRGPLGGIDFHRLELRRQQHAEAAALARALNIKLIRGYRTGELPDIQAVTPSSIWAPLNALAMQRPGIATRLLHVMLSSMLAVVQQDEAGKGHSRLDARTRNALQADLSELRSAISTAFAAGPRAAAYVDALQQLAAADKSLWVDTRQLMAAAEGSGGLGAAAVQVEEQTLYSDPTGAGIVGESAASSTRRPPAAYQLTPALKTDLPCQHSSTSDPDASAGGGNLRALDPPCCWQVLADLYRQVAEPDVLMLSRKTHLITCPGTRRALEAEAAGRHELALRHFDAVVDAGVKLHDALTELQQGGNVEALKAQYRDVLGPAGVPSMCEEGLVFEERLHCMEQLGAWAQIQEQVEADITPAGENDTDADVNKPDLSLLFTSPDKEVRDYLAPYMRACLLVGASGKVALLGPGGLLETAKQNKTWLQHMQKVAGVELAVMQLMAGSIEACKAALTDTLRAFCVRWSSSGSSSLTALQAAADTLQPAAELQELLHLLSSLSYDFANDIMTTATTSQARPVPADQVTLQESLTALLIHRPNAQQQQQQLQQIQLPQQLLPNWRHRWPAIYSGEGGQVVTVLGLRRQLLQLLQQQGTREAVQRQRFAALANIALTDLQLQAAAELVRHNCIDSTKALLQQLRNDIQGIRLARLVHDTELKVFEVQAAIAGMNLGLAQLQASTDNPASWWLIQQEMQGLAPFTASTRQTAAASTQHSATDASTRMQQLLGVSALVTEAAGASTVARLAAEQRPAAAEASIAGTAVAKGLQQYATAIQDYSIALGMLELQTAAAPGDTTSVSNSSVSSSNYASSSSISIAGNVMLEFGLLCSHLHQKQLEQQQQSAAAVWPADAAAVIAASGGFAALAVKHLLGAMAAQGGSSNKACLHVPSVLAVMSTDNNASAAAGDAISTASSSSDGSKQGAADANSTASRAFAAVWQAVPLHVFLPWVSQLLARLGDLEGKVLVAPLEALAAKFPQRVYLPYCLSRQHWQRHQRQQQRKQIAKATTRPTTATSSQKPAAADKASIALSRAGQLEALLQGLAVGDLPDFVPALDAMTFPAQRLGAWAQEITPLVQAGDKVGLVRLWADEIYHDIIGQFKTQGPAATARSIGGRKLLKQLTINEEFATTVGKQMQADFGPKGEGIAAMTLADFRQKWIAFTAAATPKSSEEESRRRLTLGRMSAWFERFAEQQANKGASRVPLLLPKMLSMSNAATFAAEYSLSNNTGNTSSSGSSSYSGGTGATHLLSDAQGPVAIYDFGRYAATFSSKQKPKRITIHGSDFREHPFVVKGGEDVRLDERIEQLFVVMSGFAGQHSGCASRSLHTALVTYDVVPASPRLGLLGFVEGTSPMQALIDKVVDDEAMQRAAQQYVRLFPRSTTGPAAVYAKAWAQKSDTEVVENLRKAERELPWDALRTALRKRASHPEVWLAVRSRYTASLAAASACGYLVGLGDRHLANLLVVESTGAVVSIDLGYAFGTAVLLLAIAELPPFRLTRQLLNVLQPHDAQGLLQPAMTAILEATFEGQQVLSSIMQVFLAEHLGEWQWETGVLAEMVKAATTAPDEEAISQAAAKPDDHTRVVDVKVNQVKLRIAGHNPVGIVLTEAKAKHGSTPAWPAMEKALTGHGQQCLRQQLPQQGPVPGGPGNVARLLLELATDERILGRCWEGWRPFV